MVSNPKAVAIHLCYCHIIGLKHILNRTLDLGLVVILEFVLVAHHNESMWDPQL